MSETEWTVPAAEAGTPLAPLEWSSQQAAIVLLRGEASVKRMLVTGVIPSRKENGRFWKVPLHGVASYLRDNSARKMSLRESALAADDAGCLAEMIVQRLAGRSLGSLFDELESFGVPLAFVERAQPLAEEFDARPSRATQALLWDAEALDSRMAACLFRSAGHEVLSTRGRLDEWGAAALILQARPSAFWLGRAQGDLPAARAAALRVGCTLLRIGQPSPNELSLRGFAHLQRVLFAEHGTVR